jgi:hypothetical protein
MVSPSMASPDMVVFLDAKISRKEEKFLFKMLEEGLRCSY